MAISGLDSDLLVLALRIGVLLLLYGFLAALFLLIRKDIRSRTMLNMAPGRLVVIESGATTLPAGHELPLLVVTTIGRDHGNVLVLSDRYVSQRHAVLTWRDGRWWLRDLGSTNGTMVGQSQVRGEVALDYGDVLTIGSTRLKLVP